MTDAVETKHLQLRGGDWLSKHAHPMLLLYNMPTHDTFWRRCHCFPSEAVMNVVWVYIWSCFKCLNRHWWNEMLACKMWWNNCAIWWWLYCMPDVLVVEQDVKLQSNDLTFLYLMGCDDIPCVPSEMSAYLVLWWSWIPFIFHVVLTSVLWSHVCWLDENPSCLMLRWGCSHSYCHLQTYGKLREFSHLVHTI